jgi:hypothetical protein
MKDQKAGGVNAQRVGCGTRDKSLALKPRPGRDRSSATLNEFLGIDFEIKVLSYGLLSEA